MGAGHESLPERFSDHGGDRPGRERRGLRRMFDREMQRMVAIKLVHPDLPEAERRRFGYEAPHDGPPRAPNIVPVHDVFRDDRRLPLRLRDEADRRPDARRGSCWSRPADGSELQLDLSPSSLGSARRSGSLHSRGVVHRDRHSRRTLMVGRSVKSTLTDWGPRPWGRLEGRAGPRAGGRRERDSRLHGARTRWTPAAEGSTGGPTCSPSGALLYEILTGRPALPGELLGRPGPGSSRRRPATRRSRPIATCRATSARSR